jgi:hypothetical protein
MLAPEQQALPDSALPPTRESKCAKRVLRALLAHGHAALQTPARLRGLQRG